MFDITGIQHIFVILYGYKTYQREFLFSHTSRRTTSTAHLLSPCADRYDTNPGECCSKILLTYGMT